MLGKMYRNVAVFVVRSDSGNNNNNMASIFLNYSSHETYVVCKAVHV